MKANIHDQVKKLVRLTIPRFFLGIILLLGSTLGFAQTIVITGVKVIDKPTTYENVVLDLTNGAFAINKNGVLKILNSTVNVTLSPGNPFFASLNRGHLVLEKDVFNVTSSGLSPSPTTQPLVWLIQVNRGTLNLAGNQFTSAMPYTTGFITTNVDFNTEGFQINRNMIKNFHGGVYLYHSNNADVNDNSFENVSFSNIFNMGNMSNFKRNTFSFPGNLSQGDAIDIVDSTSLTIQDNIISSSSSYGIFIMGGQNLFIDNNMLTDGLSYGIFIQTATPTLISKNKNLAPVLAKHKFVCAANSAITITNNYLAQNRYGLAGEVVSGLDVEDNVFIQRFSDNASRQHWTNNDVLLAAATNVTWLNNLYKEAFTQDNGGDNTQALNFVDFPAHGGVSLP